VLPPLVVGSGAPLLLPSLVVLGSGALVLPELGSAVGSTVVSPVAVPSVSRPVSLPVEVSGGSWDTAPGEQSQAPNAEPSGSHVTRPGGPSSQGHDCVSPGTHAHGGTSTLPLDVLFISSLEEPEQPSSAPRARTIEPRARPSVLPSLG
jgi:hypothetical protein